VAGTRLSASTLAGARDILIGFTVTTVVVVLVLALRPHSGVTGTISEPVCKALLARQECSIVPASATISLIQSFSTGEIQSYSTGPQPSNPTWQTKSDARGHFHIDDVPPGGYWISAQTSGGYGAGSSVPVFDGQVTQVQLFLVRNISGGICLAASDRIATPTGSVSVTQVRPGMMVWTRNASGRRVAAPVLAVARRPALAGQRILRLTLSDGRVVEVSPGHPTVTGQRVGDLVAGDLLDGSAVSEIEELPYAGTTWDLLPAGTTGTYWANDVLLGSTLSNDQAVEPSSVRRTDSVSSDGVTPSSSASKRRQSL